jgi:hypothetical protein
LTLALRVTGAAILEYGLLGGQAVINRERRDVDMLGSVTGSQPSAPTASPQAKRIRLRFDPHLDDADAAVHDPSESALGIVGRVAIEILQTVELEYQAVVFNDHVANSGRTAGSAWTTCSEQLELP